jgi:CubicO group peptidase (beta-lactamase class C family)
MRVDIGQVMRGHVPGLSLAIVTPQGIRYLDGIGQANMATGAPATSATTYPWFSMTKLVTATAVMRLVDQGVLHLDDRVGDLYEPFRAMRPRERSTRVTVRHLLSHSSGLANPVPIRWVHPATQPAPDPRQLLRSVLRRHNRLRFEPGRRANYTNVGFLILGEVISQAGQRPFTDYVSDEILQPLQMNSTGFNYPAADQAAIGYQRRRSPMTPLMRLLLPAGIMGPPIAGYISFHPFLVDGAAYGGLIGPVEDAARFLQMHLRDGELDGVRILTPDSARQMRVINTRGRRFELGLGWFRPAKARTATPAFVQHRGDGGGFATDIAHLPRRCYWCRHDGQRHDLRSRRHQPNLPKHKVNPGLGRAHEFPGASASADGQEATSAT